MKNFLEDNFEVESRMIEFKLENSMTINDLSDEEKEDIFRTPIELNFTINALEICR